MKYRSVDRLQDFEFHDAELASGQIVRDTFSASLKMLNIHKDTPQNNGERDMEIELAKVTFEGIRELTFEHGRGWYMDENGNSYTDEPQVILTGREAHESLAAELARSITLFAFEQKENNVCSIDAMGNSPFFTFQFAFDRAIIEWDNYRGIAWYDTDERRAYRHNLKEKCDPQKSS